MQLVADANDDAALCRAVKLGDGKRSDLRDGGKLLGLLESVLAGRAVEHQKHLVGGSGEHLLHHVLDFLQLVHQPHLVVQTSCGVDEHHVGVVSLGTLQGVESHRGGVAAHLLLDDGHPYPLAPDDELLHGSGTEGVGSTEVDLLASLFELPGQLANGSGLAHAVHTDNEDDVGVTTVFPLRGVEGVFLGLSQQGGNLLTKDVVQLRGGDILVTCHALLNALDNLQRGVNANIARNKHLLEIVEHVLVNLRLARHGACQLVKHGGFGLLQALVKCLLILLLLLLEKIKQSHKTINNV